MQIFLLMIPVLALGVWWGWQLRSDEAEYEAERNIYIVWTMNSGESPKLKVFREHEPANDYLMDMIGKYDDVGWCVFRHDGNRCTEIKI